MNKSLLLISFVLLTLLAAGCGGGSNSGSSSFNQGANNQWLIYSNSGGLAETAKKTVSLSFEKETFTRNTIIKLEDAVATKSPDNSLVQIGGCKFSYVAATKDTSAISYPKQLSKPITVTVKLNPARNPSEVIKVYWANEVKPEVLEEYSTMQISIDGRAASCSAEHFGYFHIFAAPKSGDDKPYEYISPVQKLSATSSTTALKLTWEKPASGDVAGYKVLWVKSLNENVVLTTTAITQTSFTDTQAMPTFKLGSKITYRVVAISKTGTTGWPAETSIKLSSLPYKYSLFRGTDLYPYVFGKVSDFTYQSSTGSWIFAQDSTSELTTFNSSLVFAKAVKSSATLVFQSPSVLSVMKDDRIVCLDGKTNELILFDKELKTSSKIVTLKAEYGTVKSIYCDSVGRIWVLFNGSTTSAIRIFDTTGKQSIDFGEKGTKDNQINEPIAMCSRATGGVYVLDKLADNQYSIKIFSELGHFVGFLQFIDSATNPRLAGIKALSNPTSIAEFSDGRVLIADTGNKRILVVGSDFKLLFVYWFEEENKTKLDPDSTAKYQVCKLQNGPTNLFVDPTWNTLTLTDSSNSFVCMLKSTDE